MRILTLAAGMIGFALVLSATADAAEKKPKTDAQLIKNAMSAAPKAVADESTILLVNPDGTTRVLRKGTGPFTCIPDDPKTPGNDPMCLDKNGMEWAQAWMSKTPPPAGKVGFGYMLQGGSDASNDDPFAKTPVAGKKWVDTGAHVMVLNPGADMIATYPKHPDNFKRPYVMWAETPYQHLMIPIK